MNSSGSGVSPARLRIDGHAHVFSVTLPMIAGRRYTPADDARPAAYFDHLKAHGLDGALLVQPSFLGTDNLYLLNTLRDVRNDARKPLLRGVAVVDPVTPKAVLKAMDDLGIVGVRLNFVGRELPDLDGTLWASHLERVESLGWHVELHIEGARLPAVLNRLTSSNSRLVVDHFGLPDAGNPLQCAGFRRLLDAAEPQLCVKLSAPYRVFPAKTQAEAARACAPLAMQLARAMGPERLIWGSDWPWTQHEAGMSYADCVAWGEIWAIEAGLTPGFVPDWLLSPVSTPFPQFER